MSKSTFRNSSKTYFFNACFDKNQLKNLISWFIKQSGEKITVDFLETIKQIGFHQATIAGVSLGLDDLQIPLQKSLLISQAKADVSLFEQQSHCGNLTNVEKSQRMISTWNQTSEILRKTAVQQFKNTNPVNSVYMMAFSGARGNISQVRQLVAMRGLMADPQGAILEFPIQSNFREGLTLTEYLISCYGARKGLVDTALRTATSGYLTRRLVDAAQHVIVSTRDCGTKQGFKLKNKDLEQHLIGRVLSKDLVVNQTLALKRNQKISPTLAKLISKNVKQVFVRSPLTCQAENSICQLCYGWNLAHGHLVSIGEAVGVIAAQSIGEPGTQLTMRTFHTGGVGVFSDQAMKYFIAPYDGIIEYTQALPGHFVRTPHGKIVYMLKNTSTLSQCLIFKLKSFHKNEKFSSSDIKETYYSVKKQDLPAGSILLVRQGERVKTGQVLAQSSQFKKSKQKMPESTHPVFSTMDGEIYFELMTILKQKQLSPKIKKIKKIQKKDNEVSPDIRTVKGLGSFWVFSSENQQEFHIAKTILRPGDLVSLKTSLFQYDFYINKRNIFYTILNKYSFGLNFVYLPLEKINFHKVTYSMVAKNRLNLTKQKQRNQKEFLFFNKKTLQNFLIWGPSGSILADSGYFFNFLFYSEIQNKSALLKNDVFQHKITAGLILKNKASFFGLKNGVFETEKKIEAYLKNSVFENENNFSFENIKKVSFNIIDSFLESKKETQSLLFCFEKGSFQKQSEKRLKKPQTKNSFSQKEKQDFSLSSTKNKKILKNNWFNGSCFYLPTKIQKCKISFPVYFENILIINYLKNKNSLKQHLLLQYNSQLFNYSNKAYLQSVSFEKRSFSKQETPKIKTKFLYCKQKNYIINSLSFQKVELLFSNQQKSFENNEKIRHTNFIKIALDKIKSLNSSNSKVSFEKRSFSKPVYFQKNVGWIYIPITNKIISKCKQTKKFVIWDQGKIVDNLLFLNSKICIKYIPSKKIGLFKSLKNQNSNQYCSSQKAFLFEKNIWYSKESLLKNNSFLLFQQNNNRIFSHITGLPTSVPEKDSTNNSKSYSKSCFYYKLCKFNLQLKNTIPFQINHANSFLFKKQSFMKRKAELIPKTQFFENEKKTSVNILRPVLRKPKQYYKSKITGFLFVYFLNEFTLPKKSNVIKSWNSMKKLDTNFFTSSPLFTKQEPTIFQKNQQVRKKFQLILSGFSKTNSWFSEKNIFKILINLNSPSLFKKVNQSYLLSSYLKNHKVPVTGLNLFLYNSISLPENVSFYFEIFENKWVIPQKKITTGFIRIKKYGEFRRFQMKKNTSIVSILTTQNLLTLDFSKYLVTSNHTKIFQKNKQVKIGTILRSGTEMFPGIASSNGGLIVNKDFTQFTIRLGIPFLASARGIIHVFQNDLIQKNDLLVTLKSRRLQTEDIVQGIPKIEQLFEARETQGGTIIRNSVHTRLKKYFLACLKSEKVSGNSLHINLSNAITHTFNKIQFFLVQSILQAYSSQGVKLSQKHIEIIVRQMTTRVRILAGGDTGLLPGELIQFTRIQKLNEQLCSLGKRPAIYEPIILGITKSVLQSESFLLSASFQEVSRVLVRSALSKKTDFLRGLHENVILGQLVPTGTGLVCTNSKILEK